MKHIGCAYYPEAWPKERWEIDIKLMKDAGFKLVRLGEFNWGKFEPQDGVFDFNDYKEVINLLYENDISVIMCTPSAAPPKWMTTAHPEVSKLLVTSMRCHSGERRHYCPSSPLFSKYVKRIVQKMGKAFADMPGIISWQIDNEVAASAENGFCHCEHCVKHFQHYLKEKYQSIDNLNKAWNGAFWSGDFSDWSEIKPPFERTSWLLDYSQFMSSLYTKFIYAQMDELKLINQNWKFTTNSWTSFIPDVEPSEIFKKLDYATCDNYINSDNMPFFRTFWDYYRNLKDEPRSFIIGETGAWNPVSSDENCMNALRVWAFEAFVRGAEGLMYFRWRQSLMGEEEHDAILPWSGKPGKAYQMIKSIRQDFKKLERYLKDLPLPQNQVAIINDVTTAFINKCRDKHSYFKAMVSANNALNLLGVGADVITSHSEIDLCKYRLIILPQTEYVSRNFANKLRAFVKSGGVLLAQSKLGLIDIYGKYLPQSSPAGLNDVFGLQIDERADISSFVDFGPFKLNEIEAVDIVNEFSGVINGNHVKCRQHMEKILPDTCTVCDIFDCGRFKGAPLITNNKFGKGTAIYQAALLDQNGNLAVMRNALKQASIEISEQPDFRVSIYKRGNLRFYLNSSSDYQTLNLQATGKVILGTCVNDEIKLKPYDVCIILEDK